MFRFLHVFQRWVKPVVAEFVATFILLFWACMLQGRFQTGCAILTDKVLDRSFR